MHRIFLTFLKRVPREGFRSLTVPALALVLVVLISVMGGAKLTLTADLDDVIENFIIRVEVSHPVTGMPENLDIDMRYILLFTDAQHNPTAGFLTDVNMSRDVTATMHFPYTEESIRWAGITSPAADHRLDPVAGAFIDFFYGYCEGIFRTGVNAAVVSPDIYRALDAGYLHITVHNTTMQPAVYPGEYEELHHETDARLRVVGIVHGAGRAVFSPFWVVGDAAEAVYLPVYTHRMCATLGDNRTISEFAGAARRYFARAGDIHTQLPFALTIFDSVYNEVTRRLQQNIYLIDIATPFVYGLSVLIGFIASYLLTRRRRPEFAVMRSMGVSRRDVFAGALAEQAVLCLAGAAAGFVIFSVVYGSFLLGPPLIFTACYSGGSIFAAVRAAGTNVLKILREKE